MRSLDHYSLSKKIDYLGDIELIMKNSMKILWLLEIITHDFLGEGESTLGSQSQGKAIRSRIMGNGRCL